MSFFCLKRKKKKKKRKSCLLPMYTYVPPFFGMGETFRNSNNLKQYLKVRDFKTIFTSNSKFWLWRIKILKKYLLFYIVFPWKSSHMSTNLKNWNCIFLRTWSCFDRHPEFLPPPLLAPLLDPMSKFCHNFFSIGRILSKSVLVNKKHSLCLFFKKICWFVCFLQNFITFSKKYSFFM